MIPPSLRLTGLGAVGALTLLALSGPTLTNVSEVRAPLAAASAPAKPGTASTSTTKAQPTASGTSRSTTSTATATTSAAASLPLPVTDVTLFGAIGDGHTDSEAAVVSAVTAAEAAGGTLYFPAGHYMLNGPKTGAAVKIHSGKPLTVAGAGAGLVTLTETNPLGMLLSVSVDHTVVQDLTLDTQSTNARQALGVGGNYITVQRCTILGGSQFFAIYAAGPSTASLSAPTYDVGNQLLNDTINEQYANDGVSWSFQANSLIENIDHTGSRLALYVVKNVTVQNYTYHPGIQPSGTAGFWLSAPSDGVTINNFTSYGKGGTLSDNGGKQNTNIAINNERLLGTGNSLRISGANGLTISGCDFGTSNTLAFEGTTPTSHVVVQNCTALPTIVFAARASTSASFLGDVYPAFVPLSGPKTTFHNYTSGLTFAVSGGTWLNQSGGFFSGTPATYSVTGLAGY